MSELSTPIPDKAPYVVSADTMGLLGRWANANGYTTPPPEYFEQLSIELDDHLQANTGLDVEIVSEAELREGMQQRVSASPHPVISLDRAYFEEDNPAISGYIDVTRAVRLHVDDEGNRSFVSAGVLSPRPGFPSLAEQLKALRLSDESPITLLDDVIFSGEGAVDLAQKLKAIGRPVARIIDGIGINEGIGRLQDIGIEVDCVRTYADVADEVCERDFLAGVPMSGRTVLGEDGEHWSAPYFLPFGDPESWASIPDERTVAFSRFCLEQSVSLWGAVEHASGRPVAAGAIPRHLEGLNGEQSVTLLLQQHLDTM